MQSKITYITGSGTRALMHTDKPLPDSLGFSATCPTCKDVRFQQGYGFRTLLRLLVDNRPIEAYCAVCKDSWSMSADERAELAWLLLVERT